METARHIADTYCAAALRREVGQGRTDTSAVPWQGGRIQEEQTPVDPTRPVQGAAVERRDMGVISSVE